VSRRDSSAHGPSVPITHVDLEFYQNEGYLIVREAFTPNRISALAAAVERIMDRAIAGEVEIGWIDRAQRAIGRTGHLLNPDLYDPAFAEWLDQDLAPHLHHLVAGGKVRHSLFNMLAGGAGQEYKQRWHRDLGRAGGDDEGAFLQRHHGKLVQFNAPLQPGDHYLQIVPNSHLRASTAAELEAAADKSGATGMPGALIVMLEPGDIVYYNANLWHRGWNPTGRKRWTMHSAFWTADYPVMKHEHGQRAALLTAGHMDRMPPITRQYVQRYLDQYTDDAVEIFDL